MSRYWIGKDNYFFTTDGMVIVHSKFLSKALTNQDANSIVKKSKQPNPPFYILDMKKVVKKALEKEQSIENLSCEVKRVANNFASIYIETMDGLLIRVEENQVTAYPNLMNRIKILSASTLDGTMLIVTDQDELHFFSKGLPVEKPKFQHDCEIILASIGPDAVAIVTRDNVLHVMGKNKYGSCGGGNKSSFTRFCPFEKKIINVKCGYFHIIVLFEDGILMATGKNNYKQCLVCWKTDRIETFTAPSLPLRNTSMGR